MSAKQVFQGFVGALLIAAVVGLFAMNSQIAEMKVEQGKNSVVTQNIASQISTFPTRDELKRVEQKGDQTRIDLDRLVARVQK